MLSWENWLDAESTNKVQKRDATTKRWQRGRVQIKSWGLVPSDDCLKKKYVCTKLEGKGELTPGVPVLELENCYRAS